MQRAVSVVVALLAVIGLSVQPVAAITFGTADGNRHPYTGALVADYVIPGYMQPVCSGTLVAPRVVLTAAHCLKAEMDPDRVWFSFDPIYRPGISTIYHGHMVTAVDPSIFRGEAGCACQYGTSRGGYDIAVVHLDESPGITPARLPTLGLLSSMELRGQRFTAVGYGIVRDDKTRGPNSFDQNFDPDGRYVATQEFRTLEAFQITFSQNPSTGDGGWCFGDSGGPNFVGDTDVMASLPVLTDTACRAMGRGFRLDTALARGFLASQGVALP